MLKKLTVLAASLALTAGSAFAGPLTNGLEIKGGQNPFAEISLERADLVESTEGLVRLRMNVRQAESIKGFGFLLKFDDSKYEYVESKLADQGVLGNQGALYLASDKTPGQITVGSMHPSGVGTGGEGALVEFVFRTTGNPVPSDFEIAEGVLIDAQGDIDQIQNVHIGNLSLKPDTFGLDQNMPNPFNPTTTINYQVPEAGEVRLVIYNLLGQEVRTLVNDRIDAGYHTVVWDGNDSFGRQVASGVYVYRMHSGDFSAIRRMMLLK